MKSLTIFLLVSASAGICVSDSQNENLFGDCSLMYNGKSHQFLMFTEPGEDVSVTVSASSGCNLRLLAVGGGGQGSDGGGGSGYVKYHNETLATETVIRLRVGDYGQSSIYTIDGATVEVEAGNDGYQDGGDGYSGGGAFDGMNLGGSDGGDGGSQGNYNGGRGSEVDIRSLKFNNFVLSPGSGGSYEIDGDWREDYGGGGGGVLVNGQGPQEIVYTQGEGYGGGGGDAVRDMYYNLGHPGVILLEVV